MAWLISAPHSLPVKWSWWQTIADRLSQLIGSVFLCCLFLEQVSPKGVYQQVIKNEHCLEKKMQNANEWKEVESLRVKAGVMWGIILPVWGTFSQWLIFLSADTEINDLQKKRAGENNLNFRDEMASIRKTEPHVYLSKCMSRCFDLKKKIS